MHRERCPDCQGRGVIVRRSDEHRYIMRDQAPVFCRRCNGDGLIDMEVGYAD